MKTVKMILRVLAAGLTAAAALCLLSAFYYRVPMHQPSTLGNTDFVWPAGASWMQMTEGISWGTFDDRGFNNPETIENPDILVLGSSHMESTYVTQDKLLSVQLQQLLQGKASVYNMGISGCHLPQTLQYLPETLEAFETPPRLLVIEAHDLTFTEEQVQNILQGSVPSIFAPKPAWQEPVLALPYLRLLAYQKNLGLVKLLNPPRKPAPQAEFQLPGEPCPADDPRGKVYDPVFSRLQELQQQYGVQLLIFYQPTEELQKDGSVLFPQDPNTYIFAEKCREYGIGFLNLTEDFEELYAREHKLPHGFVTGKIGTGHINAVGQKTAAEAVCRWIREQEGK